MRGGDNIGGSGFDGNLQHGERFFDRSGSIIDTVTDMAMNIDHARVHSSG